MLHAKDCRARAREKLKGKWGISIVVALVASLLGSESYSSYSNSGATQSTSPTSSLGNSDFSSLYSQMQSAAANGPVPPEVLTAIALAVVIIWLVIGCCIEIGENRFFLAIGEGVEEPKFGTLFQYFNIWGKAVGLRIFREIFVFLWTLLLIVPGIIAAIRYSQATYYMAENPNLGIREAMDMSKAAMKGNCGRYFCLMLSFIGWIILGVFTFGILYLWISPYIESAAAAFHIDLVRDQYAQQPVAQQAPAQQL